MKNNIAWRFLSVRRNPPLLNGKSRHRESVCILRICGIKEDSLVPRWGLGTRLKGRVVMLSPAQWSTVVCNLPVCVYMGPTSTT